jgi:hypothetical protein
MLNAFKAGWRHGRDQGDGLRSYSVWTRASAYRVGLQLGRLAALDCDRSAELRRAN